MARKTTAHDIVIREEYYWYAVGASVIPPLLVFLFFLITGYGVHIGEFTLPYWLVTVLAMIPYYLGSFFMVQTEEFAGITVLESPAREIEEGLVYAPLWLTELERFPRAIQQEQFPGEPEQISKMPDDEADRTRADMVRPMRITTGGPEDAFKDDILNARLTLEPTVTVQWQVEHQGFFQFYTNIPGKHWPEKYHYLLKYLRDTAEKALNVEMSRHSAAWVMSNKDVLIQRVHDALVSATDEWGIIICEVNVLGLEPNHATNKALGEIPTARAQTQADVIRAQGYKEKTIIESEGDATALKNKLRAEGEGIKAAAEAAGMTVADWRAGELASEILGDKTVIIGEAGLVQAMTVGKTILGGKE